MHSDKNRLFVDSDKFFDFNDVWVEYHWRYECIDNRAVVERDSTLQLVIEPSSERKDTIGFPYYYLMMDDLSMGCEIYSTLSFQYKMQDTFCLILVKEEESKDKMNNVRTNIDTVYFTR